mmetsp:Transcript_26800/g.68778  ORF Transcript_26800/g.68778 Transcript_26800/m.68778 type:complete len:265 (-) Transcript_26800:217-1011(-)
MLPGPQGPALRFDAYDEGQQPAGDLLKGVRQAEPHLLCGHLCARAARRPRDGQRDAAEPGGADLRLGVPPLQGHRQGPVRRHVHGAVGRGARGCRWPGPAQGHLRRDARAQQVPGVRVHGGHLHRECRSAQRAAPSAGGAQVSATRPARQRAIFRSKEVRDRPGARGADGPPAAAARIAALDAPAHRAAGGGGAATAGRARAPAKRRRAQAAVVRRVPAGGEGEQRAGEQHDGPQPERLEPQVVSIKRTQQGARETRPGQPALP